MFEHGWVSEEAGHVDQEILGQTFEFGRVIAQGGDIPIYLLTANRRHRHAALHPPLERAGLVQGEVVGGPGAQQVDDVRQAVLRFGLAACF